jgi:hypothetical protein
MASGHASRINRPNTWPLRPDLRREESSCQHGAVHTWHFSATMRMALVGLNHKPDTKAELHCDRGSPLPPSRFRTT